jgi:DNA-nicking Smr family endonuclease
MATKARAQRTETKKKASTKKEAEAPFFRPFASLAKKGAKKDKKKSAEEKAPSAKEAAAKKQAQAHEPSSAHPPEPSAPSEAETFAMYMAGVRTLQDRATRIPKSAHKVEPKQAGKAPAIDQDADARAALHSLVAEGYRFEVSDDGEHIEGRRVDIDPRELRRLRRGAYTIDGRLDLHGMTAAEARRDIEKYIRKRRTDGDRVVALIVGRGNHSPRGIGVLRGEIAAWLSQGPSARHVAAFASAPDDEGGSGVVLALLAR